MHKASGGSHQKKRKVFVPWKAGKNDCVYCRRDLGTEVRIHSAISDPALWPRETVEGGPPTFCVDCFGARVELGGHKSNHDYMIVDTPSMCLLSEDWTADEELRLLESLEKFGYGNWEAAAEHVGNGRTRLSCERHYARFYQGSATFPLPDLSKPPAPRDDNAAAAEPPAAAPAAAPAVAAAGGEADGTGGGDAAQGQPDADGAEPPPPSAEGEAADPAAAAAAAAAAAPVLNERAKPAQGGKTKRTTAQTMPAGFMPLRGDFDTEWTDDAELQLGLGEMEFTAEDTAEDRALKMEVLHTYNWTLGERRRRKEFVLKQALLESVRDYPAQVRAAAGAGARVGARVRAIGMGIGVPRGARRPLTPSRP